LPSCSNCGRAIDGEPKICPKCGRPTRLHSPGPFGAGSLEFLFTVVFFALTFGGIYWAISESNLKAAQSRQLITAKHVSQAVGLYADNNNNFFPPLSSSATAAAALRKYLSGEAEVKSAETYTWNRELSGRNWDTMGHHILVWMFITPNIGNGKVIVATAATNVKMRSEAELEIIKATSAKELEASNLEKPTTKSKGNQ
jgi:hypothetical protein